MNESPQGEPSAGQPNANSVRNYLLFSLSLPERALRSGAGLVGGAMRESTDLLIPGAFRSSKTYSILVRQMLDFLVDDVGGVERDSSHEGDDSPKVENFVARKAVGNFVELAGLATLHLSPMTVLAVVSDVAYGTQSYLNELADELKAQGVIDQQSTIDHVDDLLDAVARASSVTATAMDTPPLSVDGMKETIAQTRAAVATMDPTKLIPKAEVERIWGEMRDIAQRDGVSVLDVSTAATLASLERFAAVGRGALSTVKVAGTLFDRHVIDHYSVALGDIRQKGIYASLAETSGPYVDAVWRNFSGKRSTVTEELLSGRLVARGWRALGGCFRRPSKAADPRPPGDS